MSHKLGPRDTHARVFEPWNESPYASSVGKAVGAAAAVVEGSEAPPAEAATEANQWGELTSVLDNSMHPSNNPNRAYPTPNWVPPYVHTRKAFKLRV